MSDEIITRDENRRTVCAGIGNDADADILMLRVDPVTNYVLCDITAGSATSATASQIASRDENRRTVCMGWDETNEILQEVLTDSSGRILCDLTII
jgi:hypothetical protein